MSTHLYDRDDVTEMRIYLKINNVSLASVRFFNVSNGTENMHRAKVAPRDQYAYANYASCMSVSRNAFSTPENPRCKHHHLLQG
jgi:hypothetical protein